MSFKIFPDILKQIASLSDKEREKIHVLFTELGPSYSLQKEIVEYILDIRGRDKVSVEEIINQKIEKILNNYNIPREKKLNQIRAYLRQVRFPLLFTAEEIFRSKLKSLNLPSGCDIIPPPYWEDGEYKLKLNFKNAIEFSEKLQQLFKISQTKAWQELIGEQWFETLFSSKGIHR